MNLRIISGTLKRRVIKIKGAAESFRPTLERNRESVAESLMPIIPDSFAADLCAGSGAFGFELLSRGASHVDFVESEKKRYANIRETASRFGVESQCRCYHISLQSFLKRAHPRYNIIFYDPPYTAEDLAKALPKVLSLLQPGGTLVYEYKSGLQRPEIEDQSVRLLQTRKYGTATFAFYNKST